MGAKQVPPLEASDTTSLCRRLAVVFSRGEPILSALDAAAQQAPARLHSALRAIRDRVRAGARVSDALRQLRVPSFISGTVHAGECSNTLDRAFALVADRLEAEEAAPPPRDRRLYSYSLAFGRLGMMLGVGVPIGTALEAAAESVAQSEAETTFIAAARALRGGGGDLSDVLGRLAPQLPPMTVEMVRDGEREGRLDAAMSVIADYLLDEAGQKPASTRK